MPWWESGLFWGIVGIIGVCLGIFASSFFSNRKVLEHREHSSSLIPKDISNIPGLAVTMYDKPIQSLFATEITFFNGGNQTIEPSDFAKAEPLGASIDGNYYGAEINSSNPNAVPAVKVVDEHTLAVDFDFLRPKDSITLTLWHDGKASTRGDMKFGRVRKHSGTKSYFLWFGIAYMVIFTFMFSAVLTMAISNIWGSSIHSFYDFLSSPFLTLSCLISMAIICVPIAVYVIIQIIKGNV